MNAYSNVRTITSEPYLELDDERFTALRLILREQLEQSSREIDSHVKRFYYCKTATYYFDGARILFIPELLSVTTLKLDEDGDGTFEETLTTSDYNLYPLNEFPKTWIKVSADSDYSGFANGVVKGVEIAGIWGFGDGLSATPYKDSGDTVQDAGGINATVETITVTAAENFGTGQTILIGTEQIYINDIDDDSEELSVDRGVNGTDAATHSNGDKIYIYQYPADIVKACIINTIRAAQAGNWLDVTGGTETAILSVKQGLHPETQQILQNQLRYGFR